MFYSRPLARLVGELEKLPGVGPKSAQRLAFHLLRLNSEDAQALVESILEVKATMQPCQRCYAFTDSPLCEICRDEERDQTTLCVVSEPRDVLAMERTGEYRGIYHVLGGLISPLEGITPEMLRIRELLGRLRSEPIREVILATAPTIEGDTTTMYIGGLLKPLGARVTRIAFGLPVGGDLDYADQATLIQALQGRRAL
jgi:recombination protein RecR